MISITNITALNRIESQLNSSFCIVLKRIHTVIESPQTQTVVAVLYRSPCSEIGIAQGLNGGMHIPTASPWKHDIKSTNLHKDSSYIPAALLGYKPPKPYS